MLARIGRSALRASETPLPTALLEEHMQNWHTWTLMDSGQASLCSTSLSCSFYIQGSAAACTPEAHQSMRSWFVHVRRRDGRGLEVNGLCRGVLVSGCPGRVSGQVPLKPVGALIWIPAAWQAPPQWLHCSSVAMPTDCSSKRCTIDAETIRDSWRLCDWGPELAATHSLVPESLT
eukprot:1160813-Pelagomonas_calceolata.AAC.6